MVMNLHTLVAVFHNVVATFHRLVERLHLVVMIHHSWVEHSHTLVAHLHSLVERLHSLAECFHNVVERLHNLVESFHSLVEAGFRSITRPARLLGRFTLPGAIYQTKFGCHGRTSASSVEPYAVRAFRSLILASAARADIPKVSHNSPSRRDDGL